MSENLAIWNKFSTPPKSALKEIKAGRLKGMHDINPQWRIKAMTDAFGVCGIGWKYSIDRQWLEPAANGEVIAFVNISLYIRGKDGWSEAIPANGGSKLTAKESGGMYNSDEAFKMAFTDALGVAMKMLGVAADVYMGVMDGSKYNGGNDTHEKTIRELYAERLLEAHKLGIDVTAYNINEKMTDDEIIALGKDLKEQIKKAGK